MKNQPFSFDLFHRMPLIGILRGMLPARLQRVTELFQQAGFTTLEVTMNSPAATNVIAALRKNFPELNIGAGTVRNLKELKTALDAGASYIVTPVLDEAVIQHCRKEKIAIFPGAFSPTEIYRAWQAGADMVKVFPAGRLGPAYFRDLLAPLDEVQFIAVGGVKLENMADFLNAGAQGVGLGSSLFPKTMIGNENWDGLFEHFQEYADHYRSVVNASRQKK